MEKVDFKPLTYIEVEQDEPLNIKLDKDHMFTTKLQIANNFILFNSNKNVILSRLQKINELDDNSIEIDKMKVECFKVLITMLYRISIPKKNNKEKDKKYKKRCLVWYQYLDDLFMNNTTLMIGVFKKVVDYNSILKKKIENLLNLNPFNQNASERTVGGTLLSDLIKTDPNTGAKDFKH